MGRETGSPFRGASGHRAAAGSELAVRKVAGSSCPADCPKPQASSQPRRKLKPAARCRPYCFGITQMKRKGLSPVFSNPCSSPAGMYAKLP